MIRGGKKVYGHNSDSDEEGPDLTLYANAIGLHEKGGLHEEGQPRSISSAVITRYLNSLKEPQSQFTQSVPLPNRPESAALQPTKPKSTTKKASRGTTAKRSATKPNSTSHPGTGEPNGTARTNGTNGTKPDKSHVTSKGTRLSKSMPPTTGSPMKISAFADPRDDNTSTVPTKQVLPRSNSVRSNSSRYNYDIDDYEDTEGDHVIAPDSERDLELIDLDYYDRRANSLENLRGHDLQLLKRVVQTLGPVAKQIAPTPEITLKHSSSLRKFHAGTSPKTRSSPSRPSPSTRKNASSPTPTQSNTSNPPTETTSSQSPSNSPSHSPALSRSANSSRMSSRSRPATPNTLLKRVSARPITPGILVKQLSASSLAASRPPTSKTKEGETKEGEASTGNPDSQGASPALKGEMKYMNTEYFSDEDEYKNLPANTKVLTLVHLSVLIRALTMDLELFQLCFFDDYARNVINKRMELVQKEVTQISNSNDSAIVNSHIMSFLAENGLNDKLRIILSAMHKKQEGKVKEGNILTPDEAARVFPPIHPQLYTLVESTAWKILRREMKTFLRANFEQFLSAPLQNFLAYVSNRILKGKLKRFASENLADHFTAREIENLNFAINAPAFECESEERVWWNEEDNRVGWYDSYANITMPTLVQWMRKIDKLFLDGMLSVPCYVCKTTKLKYFDQVKCPTCTAQSSLLESFNRYYCKDQCLHTHMATSHAVYIAAPNQRNEVCGVCGQKHELYICKKCHSVLDFHGQHRLVLLHERSCTGPKK